MDAQPTGVRLHDVTVRFPRQAPSLAPQTVLRRIQLDVPPGQMLAIVGPSGCGKSTLLRLVAGLQVPSDGRVELVDASGVPIDPRPRVGFVFQSPNLLPWRDVRANIALPLELAGVESTARDDAVLAARRLVGLADADVPKLPGQLSGGMQMRVSLARAIVTKPRVLLLDEPFAALDDILRQQLIDELAQLQSTHRWTTLLVTHNVGEAVYLADRVMMLGHADGGADSPRATLDAPWQGQRPEDLRSEVEFARQCAQVRRLLREVTRG